MTIDNLPFPCAGSATYYLPEYIEYGERYFPSGTELTLTTHENGSREITATVYSEPEPEPERKYSMNQNTVSILYTDYTGQETTINGLTPKQAEAYHAYLIRWEKAFGIALPLSTLKGVMCSMPEVELKRILTMPIPTRAKVMRFADRNIRGEVGFFEKAYRYTDLFIAGLQHAKQQKALKRAYEYLDNKKQREMEKFQCAIASAKDNDWPDYNQFRGEVLKKNRRSAA